MWPKRAEKEELGGFVLPANVRCELADIHAIKATARGDASPEQQQRAMDWIITHAANYYERSFREGDTQATAHEEGRRFVGWLIVKIANMRMVRRQEEPSEHG